VQVSKRNEQLKWVEIAPSEENLALAMEVE